MSYESGPKQFRAIDTFGAKYPHKKVLKWKYVDQSNVYVIKVYTADEILTVEYDPNVKDISITQCEDAPGSISPMRGTQYDDDSSSSMCCPKCGSRRVNAQIVSESQLRDKPKGCIWWLLIGCWWVPVKWFFFTLPALIFKLFVPKKQEIVTQHYSMFVCQSCGHTWKP